MRKLRAADLYCGAGGAGMGLSRAGFEVVGFDIARQPRYPFEFHQGNALDADLTGFDFVWSSPPCQKFSTMTKRWRNRPAEHPDLIAPTREKLKAAGVPYVIENVPGAPLENAVTLCGSMFGLKLRRHRCFELSGGPALFLLPPCDHSGPVVGVYGHAGGSSKRDGLTFGGVATWKAAMGIDWMTGDELAEAIPPAYSEFLARNMIAAALPLQIAAE